MMSTKISLCRSTHRCCSRLLSTEAAHKPSEGQSLRSQQLKSTTLPNGLIVVSLENYAQISRFVVIVRAGARYEPSDQLGLTHTLRSMATKKSIVFGITHI